MNRISNIKDFYADSTILVTGGTGFLGKVLIEKLLRSCKGIKCIYLLMRSKKGVSCEQRLDFLRNNQIFDRIRSVDPRALNKLQYVNGDITVDNLGLSPSAEELIKESVNFVFHSAATITFNNPIKTALNTNTIGTKRILDLCRGVKHLKKLVYVSTAYTNPTEETVKEKVYKSVQEFEIDWYVKCADVLPPEEATSIMHRILGLYPNTYTMTKFLAEHLVQDYRFRFGIPSVIVRPSVIGPSYAEPFPGWTDNYVGLNGVIFAVSLGILSSMPLRPEILLDTVPLDIACNQIIVAAWFDTQSPSNDIRVVNCTSGDLNGITIRDYLDLVVKHSRENPCKFTTLYPNVYTQPNKVIHAVYEAVHTMVPAYVHDMGRSVIGAKPTVVKTLNMVIKNISLASVILCKTYKFSNKSVEEMLQFGAYCNDLEDFNIDCRSINWDEHMKNCVLGVQKYLLKTDEASIPAARRNLKGLYAAWCLYYGCVDSLTGYTLYKLLSKL